MLINAGLGTFPTSIKLPFIGNAQTYSIAAADLNNDNYPDVLFGNYGSPSRVLFNAGDGTFPTSSIELPFLGNATTKSITAADVDRDGDLDVLIGNYGSPSKVLLNNPGSGGPGPGGTGTFWTSVELPGGS